MLAPLRPPALFLLAELRFSRIELDLSRARSFGATMISASGEIFTNGEFEGGGGATETTITFTVEVGDRCSVIGSCGRCDASGLEYAWLVKARS